MKWTFLCVAAIVASTSSASAQKPPPFYGVYALNRGELTKLQGKPLSELSSFGGASGIIRTPSSQTFSDGDVRIVIYRRELAMAAPDSLFIHIIAPVVREKLYDMNGRLTSDKPVNGLWHMRDRGWKFLIAPYGDNKEQILVRHELYNFELPGGRFGFTYGGEFFDFKINIPNADPEHCVEWTVKGFGISFPQCERALVAFTPPGKPLANTADQKEFIQVGQNAPERKAILDAVRVPIEQMLGIKVIFQVRQLIIFRDWAYANVRPRTEKNTRIDYTKTQFAKHYDPNLDSDQIDVLLRREGGAWKIVEKAFLPTDVATEGWEEKHALPSQLFARQPAR